MANISARTSIRWLPGLSSEPTSTLVLTSPGGHFVDIRILSQIPGKDLDWAFAGKSTRSISEDGRQHCRWLHWVDSTTVDAESISDEGFTAEQPDGTSLETGRMRHPGTGLMTDYEETWKDVAIQSDGGGGVENVHQGVVLQTEDDANETRGMMITIGQYRQAVLRVSDEVTVQRWEYDLSQDDWTLIFKTGDATLPWTQRESKVGDSVQDGNRLWHVIEVW